MTFTYNFLLSYSAWAVGAGGRKGDAPPPPPPDFDRSVNPITTRGREIMPNTLLHTYLPPEFSYLPTALSSVLSLSFTPLSGIILE